MSAQEAPIVAGPIRIDPVGYDVTVDGRRVALTLTQFNLLKALARRPNWVHDAPQLSAAMPGRPVPFSDAALKNQVYQLRRKLGSAAVQLQTVRGLGYRLTAPSQAQRHADPGPAPPPAT